MRYSICRAVYKKHSAYFIRLDTHEGFIVSRDLTLDELRGRIRIIRDQGWERYELGMR